MSAKLNFRYSSMNAGKSAQLLQAAFSYKESGHCVALFTASIDDRSGAGLISSRIGLTAPALTFDGSTDFIEVFNGLTGVSCVLIDECQFLTALQVVDIHMMIHAKNIPVVAFGLRTDFRGIPFPGSCAMLALADDIQEVRSICSCGRKASMNMRLDAQGNREREGQTVLIGGNDVYRAICPKCFYSV